MQNERIPKVIHLMWFSGDPYPPLIAKCINSWHDIVPDYKIKLWTGDMIKDLDFVYLQDALKLKKYAFACDVVRAYALYTEGGIYMDSDVFLKRRFDEFLVHDFVGFIENCDVHNEKEEDKAEYVDGMFDKGHRLQIAQTVAKGIVDFSGLNMHRFVGGIDITFMASVKGHPFLKSVLEEYKNRHFRLSDIDEWMIGPYIYASCALQFGFEYKDQDQLLANDMMIFHADLYSRLGKSGFAVHCENFSWGPNKKKKQLIDELKDLAREILSKLRLYSMYARWLKYDK